MASNDAEPKRDASFDTFGSILSPQPFDRKAKHHSQAPREAQLARQQYFGWSLPGGIACTVRQTDSATLKLSCNKLRRSIDLGAHMKTF